MHWYHPLHALVSPYPCTGITLSVHRYHPLHALVSPNLCTGVALSVDRYHPIRADIGMWCLYASVCECFTAHCGHVPHGCFDVVWLSRRYGYCIQNQPTRGTSAVLCLCLVTRHDWHDFFNQLAQLLNEMWLKRSARPSLRPFLEALLVSVTLHPHLALPLPSHALANAVGNVLVSVLVGVWCLLVRHLVFDNLYLGFMSFVLSCGECRRRVLRSSLCILFFASP
jgi:hypothetical protein